MLLPQRKSPRLPAENYRGCHFYFVTLCCFQRRKTFARPARCGWLLDFIQSEAATKNFVVPAYCIMPDHCHILLEGLDQSSDLLRLMKSLKIKTSRRFWQQERQQLWQHAYFEHILRRPEEIQSVAWYIWLNPVRKGIAAQPEAYAYAGSLTGMKMPSAWANLDWKPEWI
jgi:REP-associated tyrosine transposase